MKSYLRFLRRNKLYTAIEVVGLRIALAFVIVLSSYIVDDMSVNQVLKETEDTYLVHTVGRASCFDEVPSLYEIMPEIEASCVMVQSPRRTSLFNDLTTASYAENQINVAVMGVSDTFFDLFTFPLSEGNAEEALASKNSVVISEEMANTLFPNGDALGKVINVFENNPIKAYNPKFADFNVNLTVTGIFQPFSRTVFVEPDMIMRSDLIIEQQQSMFHGSTMIGEYSFVKLSDGTDIRELEAALTTEFLKIAKNYNSQEFNMAVTFTPFDEIKKQDPSVFSHVFDHIRHGKLFNIYLLMSIFITIVALLDYIVLTIAFSRFRIKEIATRSLLGTSRRGIIQRCFFEAFLLLAVSIFFAVIIAVTFKDPIGQILGAEINPMSQLSEYMILAVVIVIMVAIASAVPSFILSSYSAIDVIKGEARYRDKVTLGKWFIGFAGFLSIAALSICFGVSRQTRHLINQPLGYNVDDIVYVEFSGDDYDIIYDKLKAESYVEKIGMMSGLPASAYIRTNIQNGLGEWEDVYFIAGTDVAREILGIEILEDFNVASEDPNDGKWYMCQSTYEIGSEYMQDGNLKMYRHKPLSGIVTDYKIGSLKEESGGKLTFFNITDIENIFNWGGYHVMKVNIDENSAKQKIDKLLETMGYSKDLYRVTTFREDVEADVMEDKNMLRLMVLFSLICIFMTIMTIVGLSSYHSKITEKDNAVRNVFGCTKKEIIRRIVVSFTFPVIASAVFAIPIAYIALDRWLEGFVIRTEISPVIYATALAIVILVVIVSIILQAFNSARTNPVEVLKKE